LKEKIQRQMFDYLQNLGVKNMVGVPDSTMKYFIDQGLKKNKILIATREEEAIGIAVGMSLSKCHSLVFMQNAGLANSISTITSLVQLYQIPLIFLVGWRGYLQNDAPEHRKIGEIQSSILKLIGLKSKIVKDDNWKSCCKWALKQISNGSSCCLVIQRLF
jgi:sulfopyruvate decarboxylase subunit alpha/phosphonopyruvate decarboxylase